MNIKAIARFLYARIPGLAATRFALMDLTAAYFEKPEYRGVLRLAAAHGLIVDVGANRGQSIAAFKKLMPNSKIVAFEPEPRLAKKLLSRYQLDSTVIVHDCALGGHSGALTLFVPRYGRWECDGMAATNREAAIEWLKDPGRMLVFDETMLSVCEHRIACKTLDSYELTPFLIKVHAQGAELDILKGAEQTIHHHKPALMCAFPSITLTDFLAAWGYRPYIYNSGFFRPGVASPPVTFTWYLRDNHVRRQDI